jgi:U3 small nucleolar RNA-associated protein 7
MTHLHPSTSIQDVHFSPYEDVLGYGHTGGVSSIIIPGAGSAHYNQVGTNPNETKKQRRDGEVYALLEKAKYFFYLITDRFNLE